MRERIPQDLKLPISRDVGCFSVGIELSLTPIRRGPDELISRPEALVDLFRRDQRGLPVQFLGTERVGKDQHGTAAVDAIAIRTEADLLLSLADGRKIELKIIVEDVAVTKGKGGDCRLAVFGALEGHEQVEAADVDGGVVDCVDTDSAAGWCGVVIKAGSPGNTASFGSLEFFHFDGDDASGIVGKDFAGLPVAQLGAIKDEVGVYERARCLLADGVGESPFEELGDVLVEGVILGVAFVPERKGDGLHGVIEEGVAE